MTFAELRKMIQSRRNRDTVYSSVEFWDEKAKHYRGDAVSMWANPYLNELYDKEQKQVLDRFVSILELGSTILDLGCGTGRICRYLASNGFNMTGVDYSEPTIEIARDITDGENPNYIFASYHNLPNDVEYDVLLSVASLTIVCRNRSDLSGIVQKLKNVLKPNGTIILIEPIHRGFLHRVCDLSLNEFTKVLESSGFEVNRVVELHFWPARLILSYFPIPHTITNFIYRVGQRLLHGLFRNRSMGDYKAILAVKKE